VSLCIPTQVLAGDTGDDDTVRLECKKHARMSDVYVRPKQQPMALTDPPMTPQGQLLAPTQPSAPEEQPLAPPEPLTPQVQPLAQSDVASMEVDSDDVSSEACTRYAAATVAWLKNLHSQAQDSGKTLANVFYAEVLNAHGGSEDLLRDKLKSIVPLAQGYVNFQAVPKSSKKGVVHISFLSFAAVSYPANGIYIADSIMLLETVSLTSLVNKCISVRPRSSFVNKLCTFGWEVDGAVVNGAYAFVLSALAFHGLISSTPCPKPLSTALGSIHVVYKKHDDNQARLLSNLVESAAQRLASRTIHDPFYLAQEFARCSFNPTHVKGFVKLYRQRTLANQALAMPQKVEDAVVRLMMPDKI
jgi:hypothetical protein